MFSNVSDIMSEELFWSKVDKNGAGGCWSWTAYKNPDGYGRYSVNTKMVMAHRHAWTLVNGAIPAGLVVRHKCRGACVNPDHLELGTRKQNGEDMIRDGTSTRGTKHPSCKLTEDQVRQIRARKDEGCVTLGKEFNISRKTISKILTGKNWYWLV